MADQIACAVASFVGAWIKTWVWGLKLAQNRGQQFQILVVSLTDAWIKMQGCPPAQRSLSVASLAGAWIKITRTTIVTSMPIIASFSDAWIKAILKLQNHISFWSHPSQMRGLKSVRRWGNGQAIRSHPS